jgi:hypothetical protein
VFAVWTFNLEYWALLHPGLMFLFFAVFFSARRLLHRIQQGAADIGNQLIFEESAPVAFEVLHLENWALVPIVPRPENQGLGLSWQP